ncbi:flagellar FliJ family protein [Persephonella sp.]
MDVLQGFIKKLTHEINKERQNLSVLEEKIAGLYRKRNDLLKRYSEIESSDSSDAVSVSLKYTSLSRILKDIKQIEDQIKKLETQADNIRLRIKEKNAEKKAIQNYRNKIQKEKDIEELKKETQLIDEIFNRKH